MTTDQHVQRMVNVILADTTTNYNLWSPQRGEAMSAVNMKMMRGRLNVSEYTQSDFNKFTDSKNITLKGKE